jgi:hypothetical protein
MVRAHERFVGARILTTLRFVSPIICTIVLLFCSFTAGGYIGDRLNSAVFHMPVEDFDKSIYQSMKPAAPLRNNFIVFVTTPCRSLSLSR